MVGSSSHADKLDMALLDRLAMPILYTLLIGSAAASFLLRKAVNERLNDGGNELQVCAHEQLLRFPSTALQEDLVVAYPTYYAMLETVNADIFSCASRSIRHVKPMHVKEESRSQHTVQERS